MYMKIQVDEDFPLDLHVLVVDDSGINRKMLVKVYIYICT
jgi:hypothetical protein